jgi:hypothetical protein
MSIAEQLFGPDTPQPERLQRLRRFCIMVGIVAALIALAGFRREVSDTGRHAPIKPGAESRFIRVVILGGTATAIPLLLAVVGLGSAKRWAIRSAIVGVRVAFIASEAAIALVLIEFWLSMPSDAAVLGVELLGILAFLSCGAFLLVVHSEATDALRCEDALRTANTAA